MCVCVCVTVHHRHTDNPGPSHSHRSNPIPSQSRTIVKINILSRPILVKTTPHSRLGPVQNDTHSCTAPVLEVSYIKKKKQLSLYCTLLLRLFLRWTHKWLRICLRFFSFSLLDNPAPVCSCEFCILYRPNPVIYNKVDSHPVNINLSSVSVCRPAFPVACL